MPDEPVLVTGAAGFIGSHLVDRLLADGARVVGLDNFCDYYDPARKRANLSGVDGHPNFTLCEADVRNQATVDQVVATHAPGAIAHLAAYGNVRYSIGRARLYTDVNLVGSLNLLEAARQHGVKLFVFASTSSVYAHTRSLPFVETAPCNQPLAPYPATKKAVELMGHTYHNLHGMNFTALRFFSVYGPRGRPDMMPYMVTDRVSNDQPITLFDGGQMKRDWTFIDDVIDGLVTALGRPLGYEVINLGRGEPVLMRDFVAVIEDLAGKKAIVDTQPAPPSEPKVAYADIAQARSQLDYDPKTPIDAGLARMWAWYRDQVAT